MQTLFTYLQKRRQDHAALVAEARANATELNTKTLAQLMFFALALLVIAFIGYQLQGYHFAFPEINSLASHIPEWVLHNMTVFGDGTLILSLVLALANRNVQLHWVVFWAAVIGAIVSNTLKGYFDAPRPPAVLVAGEFLQFGKIYKQYSFPSGHTLTAFLIATVGYYFASRAWQKVGFIALGVMVGLSRIWLGVHWPMDTLVGGALGIFCGSAAVVIGWRWRSGINPVMHGFIVFLLVVAALLCLLDKNDYQYALPMLYVVALLGLWRTIRNYLLPVIKDEHPPLTPTSARFPFQIPGPSLHLYSGAFCSSSRCIVCWYCCSRSLVCFTTKPIITTGHSTPISGITPNRQWSPGLLYWPRRYWVTRYLRSK